MLVAPGEQDEKGQGKALGALLVLHLTVYFSQVPLDVKVSLMELCKRVVNKKIKPSENFHNKSLISSFYYGSLKYILEKLERRAVINKIYNKSLNDYIYKFNSIKIFSSLP